MLEELFIILKIGIIFDISRLVIYIILIIAPITMGLFYFSSWLKNRYNSRDGSIIEILYNYIFPGIFFLNIGLLFFTGSIYLATVTIKNIITIPPDMKFEDVTMTYEKHLYDNTYYLYFDELKNSKGKTYMEYCGDITDRKFKKDILPMLIKGKKYQLIVVKDVPSQVPWIDAIDHFFEIDLLFDYKKSRSHFYGIKGHGLNYDFRPALKENLYLENLFLLFIAIILFPLGILILKVISKDLLKEISSK